MTLKEMNDEFDTVYENISSGAAPNLNVYEKSLFLTRAQYELVRMYYNGKNLHYDSFESNEEVRRYLDTLITTKDDFDLSQASKFGGFTKYKITKPKDVMFVVREHATISSNGCLNGQIAQVIPVIHEDINRVLNDPFKRPNERKILRYDESDVNNVVFNLISKNSLGEYTMVYLRKPKPIILGELEGDHTIEGEANSVDGTPEIPELLQRKVINRAVELAKVAYVGDLNATFAVNARDL